MVAYPFPSAATEALVDCSTERLRRLYPISTPKNGTSLTERAAINTEYEEMLAKLCNIKEVWCLPKQKGQ
jgi:hypothetical protein